MKINFVGSDKPLEGYGYIIDSFKKVLAPHLDDNADVVINHATPNRLERVGKFPIASTMTEGSLIPIKYAEYINTYKGLLVPCPQNVQAMRDSGVTVPIKVTRHGTRIIPRARSSYLESRQSIIYRFGHLSKPASHKNIEMIVEAFVNEFSKNEPVQLWLKLRGEMYTRFKINHPNVRIIWKDYTEKELTNFYHSVSCLVFPSHGEGDGLPTREAMSAGLPVILTNWGGLAQQCDEEYNYPLKIDGLIKRPDLPPYPDGEWADPDFDELCRLMRHCYENQEEARMKGIKAADWIRNEWTWEKIVPGFMQAVEEIVEGK